MGKISRPLRCAAVHDLSGFGRCSLTVALPVLSVMGVQVSCLPTAVLSTHTGGFQGYTFRDLTEDMAPFYRHWQKEGFAFDALYTGYLGSIEQIALVEDFIRAFRTKENLVLVDPVMGDHGRLYSLFTQEMAEGMKRLCACADVIVPNMTEAASLTGMEYRAQGHDDAYLARVCEKLLLLGAKNVVLTGVSQEKDCIGAACHDGKTMKVYATERIDAAYDGTGDLFASVLLGAYLHGGALEAAMHKAADFTHDCVAASQQNGTDLHHGVDFEPRLWRLGREIFT